MHRYPDRVLIKLVAVCAVYCRFCFRRERIGPGSASLSESEFAAALDYVRADPAIWEVILTGGDPLTLSPRRIAATTGALAAIDHVRTLRWHTRMPVAAPESVTAAMARALRAEGKTAVVAVHANHPHELGSAAWAACRRLADHGVMLVSQSVLLKGVNDDVETLDALMRAFVHAGVKPYYLHHGDLAPGTAHWRVPIAKGQALMRDLRARLSGLAMPTYVLDIPGGHGKVPAGPPSVRNDGAGRHIVTDSQGEEHIYVDRLEEPSDCSGRAVERLRRAGEIAVRRRKCPRPVPGQLTSGRASSRRPTGAAAGYFPGREWRSSTHRLSAPPSAW